jgi:glycosyltransferase involved in cell wall biosynthesis
MIPRIIHQTWKTTEVPGHLSFFQRTWAAHHPGWEYRFWTDADCRDFIASQYPHFLPIYDGYADPICRVDAIRYFLLRHFGGVYADLDFECLRPLDPLLEGRGALLGLEPPSHVAIQQSKGYEFDWILCNALMASEPGHPFWEHVLARLIESTNQPGPLDATGPFFLTRALHTYPDKGQVSVLPAELLYPADSSDCDEGRLFDPEYWDRVTRRAYTMHHWAGTWFKTSEGPPITLPSAQGRARLLADGRVIADTVVHVRQVGIIDPPLVSCLMVTRGRAAQAQCAVRCFQAQTYPARELIVLDDGEDRTLADWIADQKDARIRYRHLADESTPLGELRNRAVALASGDYICQWDDDDLYDPARIETQMAMLRALDAEACLLSRWLIWWPMQGRLGVSVYRPWEGSLLCIKSSLPAYPDSLRRGEDTPVIDRLIASRRVLLLDLPRLYVYVIHQDNTFDSAHFDRHWQVANPRFEEEGYTRIGQELRKRLDLDAYLEAIGLPPSPAINAPSMKPPASSARTGPIQATTRSDQIADTPPVAGLSSSTGTPRPSILILTPIKNAARFLPAFFDNLLQIDYPREQLSLAFLESDSEDDTRTVLRTHIDAHNKDFARIEAYRQDFGFKFEGPRWQPHLQFRRRGILGQARTTLFKRAWRGEEWVLWIDADVVGYPREALDQLLATGKSIVVPHCVQYPTGPTFDLNTFKFKPGAQPQEWRHLVDGNIQTPRGQGRLYLDDLRGQGLVEIDGVGGTMLLVKAEIHAQGILFPHYSYRGYLETEGFAMLARDRGLTAWGLPDLEIIHAP